MHTRNRQVATEKFNCVLGDAGTCGNRLNNLWCIWLRIVSLLDDNIHTDDCLRDFFDCMAFRGNQSVYWSESDIVKIGKKDSSYYFYNLLHRVHAPGN